MIPTIKRVVLYARFSSDNQRSESIDAQIRAMEQYCKQHNYIIVNTYIDEAKSATTDRRPSFQKLIADSASRTFDGVVVHKLDRFSRSRTDSAIYKRELKKNGVTVYSVLENLDDSPESIMLESVLEGMNEYYSQNLARETMKGMRETALQAKHTGGIPPLGFDLDETTRRLIINQEEAETVKIIFDMYSKGYGYSAILNVLHTEGRKTKTGNEFRKNSLYSILTNPKYQGTYVFNRASSKNAEGKRNSHLYKSNEEMIVLEGGCPRIIAPDVYEKVQKRISAHQRTGGKYSAKEAYLLSGKLHCADCGRAMVGNKRVAGRTKLPYITYRCPSKRHLCGNKEINRDLLEQFVIKLVEKEILNHTALKKIIKKMDKFAKSNPPTDYSINNKITQINSALKNIADAIASGLISDSLIRKLNELEAEKFSLEQQLLTTSSITTEVNASVIMEEYNNVKSSPSSPEYQAFITEFIENVIVGKYTVTIILKTGLDIFPELDSTYKIRRQEIYEKR